MASFQRTLLWDEIKKRLRSAEIDEVERVIGRDLIRKNEVGVAVSLFPPVLLACLRFTRDDFMQDLREELMALSSILEDFREKNQKLKVEISIS